MTHEGYGSDRKVTQDPQKSDPERPNNNKQYTPTTDAPLNFLSNSMPSPKPRPTDTDDEKTKRMALIIYAQKKRSV